MSFELEQGKISPGKAAEAYIILSKALQNEKDLMKIEELKKAQQNYMDLAKTPLNLIRWQPSLQ